LDWKEKYSDSTLWFIGYNNWIHTAKDLESTYWESVEEEDQKINIHNTANCYLDMMERLGLKRLPEKIGSSEYIKWLERFLFGVYYGLLDTTWEKFATIFHTSYLSLFEIYWSRYKSKIYANRIFSRAMNFYYKDYDEPKQYHLSGYRKVSQQIEQMLAYPLSWPYIKRIISHVKKNKSDVWNLPKIDKWKRGGLFGISPEEILGRELKEDEKIVHELTLLLGNEKIRKSTIAPDWVTVGKKSYGVKEMVKKYGYDKYWKQRSGINDL